MHRLLGPRDFSEIITIRPHMVWNDFTMVYLFCRQSVCSVCLGFSVQAQLILKQVVWEGPPHLSHVLWGITVQQVNIFLGIMLTGKNMPCFYLIGVLFPLGTKSGHEFPCPSGTYSNELGISSVGQCIPCPSGLYCGSFGLSTPIGDCSPG